jgi:hypothetical protein
MCSSKEKEDAFIHADHDIILLCQFSSVFCCENIITSSRFLASWPPILGNLVNLIADLIEVKK